MEIIRDKENIMKEKQIEIKTAKAIYHLPLSIVADNRAKYYSNKENGDSTYKEEFDFVMEDDYEGIDWIKNNMNYEDYSDKLVLKENNAIEEDFNNAEMDIIG